MTPDATPGTTPDVPPDPPAVARYRAALGLAEVYEFPLTPLDTTGVPVWCVATWLPDGAGGGEHTSGIGYGETDDRARTGAWGELAEGVAAHRLRAGTPRRASHAALAKTAGAAVVDPLDLRLPLGTDYTPETERLWTRAARIAPDGTVAGEDAGAPGAWVLLEEAAAHGYNLPGGYRPLYPPITNGMGAGDTRARAVAHGLLELVQRDATSVGYRAFDRGLVIDLETVDDAACRALVAQYRDAGITLMAKLAGTPLGIPVVYVEGRERDLDALPHPLVLTGCGEGAHPDRAEALRKALLEYGASRVRKRFAHGPLADVAPHVPPGYLARVRAAGPSVEEGRSLEAVRAWAKLGAREQLRLLDGTWFRDAARVRFDELPTTCVDGGPEALAACVAGRMAEAGLSTYAVDAWSDAPGDGSVDSIAVVKTIVPGMEVETVTYGRIGPRNVRRLLARIAEADPLVHPDLVGLGLPPAGAQAVPLSDAGEAALDGPAWVHADLLEEALGPLYAMYREPAEHVVGLGHEREAARSPG